MRRRGRIWTLLIFPLLLVGFGAFALPASADEVIAPVDGAAVSSSPTFQFTVLNGAAEVELSRSSDVKSAGPDTGAFVESGPELVSLLYTREPRDGLAPWTSRWPLERGTWFWHARVRDDSRDNGAGDFGPWGQVRRLVAADDDPVLEGWTLRTQRLRGRKDCARRVRFSGRIAWSDNSAAPRVAATIFLTAGRWDSSIDLPVRSSDHTFSVVKCTRWSRLMASVQLEDDAGHTVVSDERRVQV